MSTEYPNVPVASGIPPVKRTATQVHANLIILVADAVLLAKKFATSQWGIFAASGAVSFTGSSVVGLDYRKGYRVADYPVAGGQFASYKKVAAPWDARISIAVDGSTALRHYLLGASPSAGTGNRGAFLKNLDAAVASTDLFTVLTPEITYPKANLVHYSYRRQSRGASSMFIVDIMVQEVRPAPSEQFTTTKSASGTADTNGGVVQASPVTGTYPGPI